jgi:hypothetical protein
VKKYTVSTIGGNGSLNYVGIKGTGFVITESDATGATLHVVSDTIDVAVFVSGAWSAIWDESYEVTA